MYIVISIMPPAPSSHPRVSYAQCGVDHRLIDKVSEWFPRAIRAVSSKRY